MHDVFEYNVISNHGNVKSCHMGIIAVISTYNKNKIKLKNIAMKSSLPYLTITSDIANTLL